MSKAIPYVSQGLLVGYYIPHTDQYGLFYCYTACNSNDCYDIVIFYFIYFHQKRHIPLPNIHARWHLPKASPVMPKSWPPPTKQNAAKAIVASADTKIMAAARQSNHHCLRRCQNHGRLPAMQSMPESWPYDFADSSTGGGGAAIK